MPLVMPGKAVTTLRGMVHAGQNVEARDFSGGAEALRILQSKGAVAQSENPQASTVRETPRQQAAEVSAPAVPEVSEAPGVRETRTMLSRMGAKVKAGRPRRGGA